MINNEWETEESGYTRNDERSRSKSFWQQTNEVVIVRQIYVINNQENRKFWLNLCACASSIYFLGKMQKKKYCTKKIFVTFLC